MGARITQGESQELRDAVSRALAGFLGALALLAVVASMGGGTDHLELSWLDIRSLPDGVATGLLLVSGCLWVLAALVPRMGPVRRTSTVGVTLLMATIALANAANVGWIWATGSVRTGFPVPLSLLLGAVLLWLASLIREVPAYWLYYFRSVLPGSRQTMPAVIPALRPGSPFQSQTPSHAQAHAHPSRDQCHPGPRGASFAHPDC